MIVTGDGCCGAPVSILCMCRQPCGCTCGHCICDVLGDDEKWPPDE